jgi:hypothetical protein
LNSWNQIEKYFMHIYMASCPAPSAHHSNKLNESI